MSTEHGDGVDLATPFIFSVPALLRIATSEVLRLPYKCAVSLWYFAVKVVWLH